MIVSQKTQMLFDAHYFLLYCFLCKYGKKSKVNGRESPYQIPLCTEYSENCFCCCIKMRFSHFLTTQETILKILLEAEKLIYVSIHVISQLYQEVIIRKEKNICQLLKNLPFFVLIVCLLRSYNILPKLGIWNGDP